MSKKKTQRVMTTKHFAEAMKVNYRTALNWLEAGLVPGAEKKETLVGTHWEIPESALTMERPKPGPKPRTKKSAFKAAK